MNGYLSDYVDVLKSTATFGAPGNGAFIHSCHNHCEGLAAGWTGRDAREAQRAPARVHRSMADLTTKVERLRRLSEQHVP